MKGRYHTPTIFIPFISLVFGVCVGAVFLGVFFFFFSLFGFAEWFES